MTATCRRTTGEWAHDAKAAILADFAGVLRDEGPLVDGGWSLEIVWRETVIHPHFGQLREERAARCLRWVRNEATVVAIALAMQARGLGSVIWRDGGGRESRREFRPARAER